MHKFHKSIIALLLCFCLVLTCVPGCLVTAAAAESDYIVSGIWDLKSNISLPSEIITQRVVFSYDDIVHLGLHLLPDAILGCEEENAFVDTQLAHHIYFSTDPDTSGISFDFGTTPQSVSSEFYFWLTENAVQVGSVFTSTIIIGSHSYVFPGSVTSSAPVTISVTENGCTMTDGTLTYEYFQMYPTISGFALSEGGAVQYAVGAWFSFVPINGNFVQELFPVAADGFASTVNIYSNDGSQLLYRYQERGAAAPEFTINASDAGCTILGVGIYQFDYADGELLGFASTAGSADVFIAAGSAVGFAAHDYDFTVDLYVVPAPDSEFQGGVLAWLRLIFDNIVSLPDKIGDLIFPSQLNFLFDLVDFSEIGGFFRTAYDNARSLFGLRDLVEDPAGPFAWMEE